MDDQKSQLKQSHTKLQTSQTLQSQSQQSPSQSQHDNVQKSLDTSVSSVWSFIVRSPGSWVGCSVMTTPFGSTTDVGWLDTTVRSDIARLFISLSDHVPIKKCLLFCCICVFTFRPPINNKHIICHEMLQVCLQCLFIQFTTYVKFVTEYKGIKIQTQHLQAKLIVLAN